MRPTFAAPDAASTALLLIEKIDLEAAAGSFDPRDRAWIAANGFTGALGEVLALPGEDGALSGVLVGWGDAGARRNRPFALAGVMSALPAGPYHVATPLSAVEADEAALGWLLGAYRFTRASAPTADRKATLVAPKECDAPRAQSIASAVWMARDLVNKPTSELGPAALAAEAVALAEKFGAEHRVTEGDALLEKRFPLIHAVGRAGAEAPRLIDLRWGKRGAPKIAIIGKGVCFDTGGLNLKPASAMRLMKKDMGGAAAALALARMIMDRRLPVRLRVLVPAVENAVSASSFRPGDVLTSRSGLTVEIGNTDAEGRLVLADAMTYAAERSPDVMVDFATLTGAARVALGPDLPALFTPSDALAAEVAEAGAEVRDPVWRMPLWEGYAEDVASPIADLDNAPDGGMGGAITAALFLQRFAQGAGEWAHFDIFGWNPKARPGRPKGGDLHAARAVFRALEKRYG